MLQKRYSLSESHDLGYLSPAFSFICSFCTQLSTYPLWLGCVCKLILSEALLYQLDTHCVPE